MWRQIYPNIDNIRYRDIILITHIMMTAIKPFEGLQSLD